MATKTPKTKAGGLRALEEVPTTARRRGAPKDFTFIENSSDEEESSSSDSEVEHKEKKQQQKKTPAGGGKKKSRKQQDEADDADQLNLFELLLKSSKTESGGLAVANRWIPRADSEPGICELLALLLTVGGVSKETAKIDEFKKSASVTLQDACESAEMSSGAAPIQEKTSETKRLISAFRQFFFEVGKSRNRDACVSAFEGCLAASTSSMRAVRQAGTVGAMELGIGLLNRTEQLKKELERTRKMFEVELNECYAKIKNQKIKQKVQEASEKVIDSLIALSKAASRKLPANEAEISADDPADQVLDDVQEAIEQWRPTGKDGSLSDKARQLAVECVKVSKELRASERRALEGKDSVFHEVAKARFRDVDPMVRATTASLLGEWSVECPEAMSVSHRSKYLGWMLFDKSEHVRIAALEALTQMAEKATGEEIQSRLAAFVSRFTDRLRGMFYDKSPAVIAKALRLCLAWKRIGLVTVENDFELFEDAEDLLFIAPEREDVESSQAEKEAWLNVRIEAARVTSALHPRLGLNDDDKVADDVAESVKTAAAAVKEKKPTRRNPRTKKTQEEANEDAGDEEEKENDAHQKNNNVRMRALVDIAQKRLSGRQSHLDVVWAFEAIHSLLEEESKPQFLMDVETICDLLSDDTYCKTSDRVPQLLAAILVCALERRGTTVSSSTTTNRPARGNRKGGKTQAGTEDVIARRISSLVNTYYSEDVVLERLFKAVELVPAFTNQNQLETVVKKLTSALLEKSYEPLLLSATSSLALLCDESRSESKTAKAALDKTIAVVAGKRELILQSSVDEEQETLPWMMRAAILAGGTPAGSAVIGGEEGLRELLAGLKKVKSADESSLQWMAFGLRLALWGIAWEVLALTSSGGKEAATSESISTAKRNRNALAEAFRACFEILMETNHNDAPGVALQVLGTFHDARTVLWPGASHIGWSPSKELQEKADALFMDKVIPSIEENDSTAIRTAYERVLLPMARSALFASPREDAKSSALVLRFIQDTGNAMFRRCAMKVNGELRKTDVDRWLQAHLETLCLDASYSEALSRTLGPSSERVVAAISGAVSSMICRAIRIVKEDSNNESLLNAVLPYLSFCKQGSRARERIIQLWNQFGPAMREATGDEEFGAAFENKLLKGSGEKLQASASKKRDSTGGHGDDMEQNEDDEGRKKPRTSQSGTKRSRRSLGPKTEEDEEEENETPRKTAKPLNLVVKSSDSKKKNRTESDKEHLEKSVFDRAVEEEEDDQADPLEEEEEEEKEPPRQKTNSKSKAKQQPPQRKTKAAAKTAVVEEDDDVENSSNDGSDSDDGDDGIGFRPRIKWQQPK